MSDPIEEAAAQIATQQTTTQEGGAAAAGEPLTNVDSQSSQPEPATAAPIVEATNIAAAQPEPVIAEASEAEHPHTSILRRLTETLRRKFNMFDSELEAILKDAESHL